MTQQQPSPVMTVDERRKRLVRGSLPVALAVYMALLWTLPLAASVLAVALFCVLAVWTLPMRSLAELPFEPPAWWSNRDRAMVLWLLRWAPAMCALFALIEMVRITTMLFITP